MPRRQKQYPLLLHHTHWHLEDPWLLSLKPQHIYRTDRKGGVKEGTLAQGRKAWSGDLEILPGAFLFTDRTAMSKELGKIVRALS